MTGRAAKPRWQAVRVISAVLDRAGSLAEAGEHNVESDGDSDPRDAAFARHLAYGVLRWLNALEWLAGALLDHPLKRRDLDIHRLILVGLFELWKGDSAQHAAINETAECARVAGKPWAVGLVNAVLRRFQRERSEWLRRLESRPERFAHPEWLVERIRSDWPDDWESILEANNRQAGLWLRVNRTRADVRGTTEEFEAAGFETRRQPHAQHALEVIPPAPVEQLPGFADGSWSVQDPAAQLATDWLDPQPGQRVLDACAAPGGKTCHILEAVQDVQVVALDRSPRRLDRLQENAQRLGLWHSERLDAVCADASQAEAWWDGEPFDRILLDAPCTATGVIRRHPEIKWLRTPVQLEEAVALQASLLKSLWPLLKPGGILVYATCSILRDENNQQIRHFVEYSGELRPQPRPEARQLAYGRESGEGRQVLPGEADMDGFFYARLRAHS